MQVAFSSVSKSNSGVGCLWPNLVFGHCYLRYLWLLQIPLKIVEMFSVGHLTITIKQRTFKFHHMIWQDPSKMPQILTNVSILMWSFLSWNLGTTPSFHTKSFWLYHFNRDNTVNLDIIATANYSESQPSD